MYLCSNSRPDIQFAVHQCARFTHCPRRTHEEAIIRICRYLLGTREKGLRFKPGELLQLDCYVDADFAGLYNVESHDDPVCVKSRTGYVLTLGSCPLLWVSKLQTEVTLSTTEAEYVALSQSMRDLLPMRAKLKDVLTHLNLESDDAQSKVISTVFEDNNGCLALATSPKINPRTKHIAVKYHHFRGSVGKGTGKDGAVGGKSGSTNTISVPSPPMVLVGALRADVGVTKERRKLLQSTLYSTVSVDPVCSGKSLLYWYGVVGRYR